jgi:hypothetical protein
MATQTPSTTDVQNPFESPRPRGVRTFQGALRVIVALQCFGLAASRLHLRNEDAFVQLLAPLAQLPADQVGTLSDFLAYGVLLCGVVTLLRPVNFILLALTGYLSASLLAPVLTGEATTSTVLAQASQLTRPAAVLALLLVDFWPPRIKASLVMCLASTALLKLGAAISLIAWGYLAIEESRQGGELLRVFHEALLQITQRKLSDAQTSQSLGICGGVAIGLALSIMSGRSKGMLIASVLAGGLIAMIPTFADGKTGYAQTLAQLSLPGSPLAILIFMINCVREQPLKYLPEQRKTVSVESSPFPSARAPKK